MDKETLSNYGWITICVLVLAVMIALATPFGEFVGKGFKATYEGLSDTTNNALGVVRLSDVVGGGNEEQETYEITNSPDAPVTTSTPLTFTSNADFSKFVRVEIDGETVSSDNYTAVSGSTIITLDGEYVATLENGTHTLTIVSTDGEASCSFEISIPVASSENINAAGTLKLDKFTYQTGDTIALSVYVLDNPGINAIKITDITSDASLTYISTEWGEIGEQFDMRSTGSSAKPGSLINLFGGLSDIHGDGRLATLYYQLNTSTPGAYTISATLSQDDTCNTNYELVDVTAGGTITFYVATPPGADGPGDLYGSEEDPFND